MKPNPNPRGLTIQEICGRRCRRGPDWHSDNEDGGRGYLGRIRPLANQDHDDIEEGQVSVDWDVTGYDSPYAWGKDGGYALEIVDEWLTEQDSLDEMARQEELEKATAAANQAAVPTFKVGDKVRLKPDLKKAKHGFGHKVKPGDIGVVVSVVLSNGDIRVDFKDKHEGWLGDPTEFDLLKDLEQDEEDGSDDAEGPEPKFKVGDLVDHMNLGKTNPHFTKGRILEVLTNFATGHRYKLQWPTGGINTAPEDRLVLHTTSHDTSSPQADASSSSNPQPKEPHMGKTLDQAAKKHDVATIVHHGEKLILPEKMTLDGAIDLLVRRKNYLQEDVQVMDTFDAFPFDGAHALDLVLTKRYGWSPVNATPGMFGPQPPKLITIEVGPGQTKAISWGRFALPGIKGNLNCDVQWKDNRLVFRVVANIKREDEDVVKAIFDDLRAELKVSSIYRGKAIKIRFKDDNGDDLPMPEPKFLETKDIDERMLVYPDTVTHAIQTNLFTPIERVQDLIANGIPIKRGVLLGGTYGTGKTLAAKVASKKAVENGITYVYVPHADELAKAIEFAKQYQSPACVVFCEDIDRTMNGERTVEMDDILNIVDGIDTKSTHVLIVLTTNHLDKIAAAMLRPGRLDAVIEVLPPDAHAVERLLRVYGGDAIKPDVDLSTASAKLSGQIPAVIAEVVRRAKLDQLTLQKPGELVTVLSEEALIRSAETMEMQLRLLREQDAKREDPAPLETALSNLISKAVNAD